jgi:nicotinate dehydrogenase subunit B
VSAAKAAPGLDRRDFVRLLGGGIIVLFTADLSDLVGQETRTRGYPTDFNAYLRIAADGRVTVYSGKIEMGQGVVTSLAQMAADELGVPLASIDMVMGDTATCPFDNGTYGSMSTRFFGPALRAAAAEARAVLVALAGERLGAPAASLRVEDGVVLSADGKARVSFGDLAKGQKIVRALDGKAVPKSVADFRLMGKATKRLDARAKVTGKAIYAGDVRLPGMLYAKVLRPPAHGAARTSLDLSAAAKVPGALVVNEDGLVAVLHADPEAAEKALALVKAGWDVPAAPFDDRSVFDHLLTSGGAGQESEKKGDLAEGAKKAAKVFEGEYRNGYGAHAAIETHTALARLEDGEMTVWNSTQTPFPNQAAIAQAIGLPKEKVRVITPFVGGGFGGKSGGGGQAIEAAKLAKITGRPVQVSYSRAEEFFLDSFRPAAVVKIRSGLDAEGRICLFDTSVWAAGTRGAEQFYDVPNNLLKSYGRWGSDSPKMHLFATGPWRAPGANLNVFARESQIDTMAAAAKADALQFRLDNTSDRRMRGVLEAAAAKFGWKKAAAPSGRGVGIACGIDAGTYVALIAQVKVDAASGKVAVERIVCAQDMGIVINPDGATMQMEGCVMMALGYALTEEVKFSGGKIHTQNFDTYELPRFSRMPALETVLVKNEALAPQGGGEPALVPVGGAIASAIFDATGARVTEMPMTPDRVRRALAAVRKTGA